MKTKEKNFSMKQQTKRKYFYWLHNCYMECTNSLTTFK